MHYKNGREVKVGDQVVGRDHAGAPVAGIVARVTPGATTCNICVAPANGLPSYNSSEFIHLDDVVAKPQEPADVTA